MQSGQATELKTLPRILLPPPTHSPHGEGGDAKVQSLKKEVAEVATIMHSNVQKAMERGEGLHSLSYRTEELAVGAQKFKRGALLVRRKAWWQDHKMTLAIVFVVVLLALAALAAVHVPKALRKL